MKTISVREFQLHASRYLKELPLTLTQYSKPVAIVKIFEQTSLETTKIEYYNQEEKLNLAKETLTQVEANTQHLAYSKPVKDATFRFCLVCRQMKEGVESREYLQDMEKTSDNMCPSCTSKIPMDLRVKEYSLPIGEFAVEYKPTEYKPYPKPIKKKK